MVKVGPFRGEAYPLTCPSPSYETLPVRLSLIPESARRAFEAGVGVITLTNVQCTGRETRLTDCATSLSTGVCTHDAGVRCHMHTGK